MGDLDFTIKNGFGTYSNLDKEYNKFIKKTLNELGDSDNNRWNIYNLIIEELIRLELYTIFEEVKYRLTDGENPNNVMLDVVNREEFQTELSWFLISKIEEYIEEDFYNLFY